MNKTAVSQDFLYQYLTDHNVTISFLAKRMGASVSIVSKSLRHKKDRLGHTMRLTPANIERLNVALPVIAEELRASVLSFGSDQTFTNSWGRTYDPALRQPILDLSRFFKITPFLLRVLGWKKGKRDMVLVSRNSLAFGHISQDDVNKINAELLSLAGVLSGYEVIPDVLHIERNVK